MHKNNTPLVLLILDGWGNNEEKQYNAIKEAPTPNWDNWVKTYPYGLLKASGEAVGLPKGQIGNSEVGHMHIGAGRLILQDLTRINAAIATKEWEKNKVLLDLISANTKTNTLQVMGLLSKGGVHSHEKHLLAFLSLCAKQKINGKVALHLFLDGRDTSPKSAIKSIELIEKALKNYPFAHIASLCGRYFAMDRDKRWDRTLKAYDLVTQGIADKQFPSAMDAINYYYQEKYFDEFIPPTVIGEKTAMQNNDNLFFFNFRPDRARQLTNALIATDFAGFTRKKIINWHKKVTMTPYQDNLPAEVAFPKQALNENLGAELSLAHIKQLRIAETEKYAHVTFFLNGGREKPYPLEDRILIPSPLVKTYDLKPEMSARAITQQLIEQLKAKKYEVIICNFANADMVGHTGIMPAAIDAIACLDECMGEIKSLVIKQGGCMLITADHGNAEVMFDEKTGQAHTAHTNHLVPFLFIGSHYHYRCGIGSLIDIAPTILYLLGISKPKVMTGQSLLYSP
ncbi:MAG: phosphoglycerate mutase (2,3-diphosphoglycerate-independent) [Legionellales bacterium RIFCSPHIGHO2_12_FULL_37_14]|nr:MAG: phosphoglycerate mutase (2,3-diphosphoglycerate-independent) [Legionellales bacterium RIFCSPHIGHO2_12_FULL_37_14]